MAYFSKSTRTLINSVIVILGGTSIYHYFVSPYLSTAKYRELEEDAKILYPLNNQMATKIKSPSKEDFSQ